jgi:prepilin signal peptidase PulO-like enzyme (type II secretory pathway)
MVYLRFGFGFPGVSHTIVVVHLGILSGLDVCYRVLPDKVLLSTLVATIPIKLCTVSPDYGGRFGLCAIGEPSASIAGRFSEGLLGALLSFGLLYFATLFVPGSLGGGDIKMAGVIGFYLGIFRVLSALELAFLLACAYSIPLILLGRMKATDSIPLGLFLSMGSVLLLHL